MTETQIPKFCFSIDKEIENHCPIKLENKIITKEDFIPTRSKEYDTGFDLRCGEYNLITLSDNSKIYGLEVEAGKYFKMKLGIKMFAPKGWWLLLAPRSSTFIKEYVHSLYGILDEQYEQQLQFCGHFLPDQYCLISNNSKFVIQFGQKIAQAIPCPRYDMEREIVSEEKYNELCKLRSGDRGINGFGSSGKF